MQSAGGIGGLLAVEDHSGGTGVPPVSYLVFADANGNVGQIIDWRPIEDWENLGMAHANAWHPSRLAARYEYDPYGNCLLDPADPEVSGPSADANPFRFSTKHFDSESGQYYYGYRYLDPPLGRWTSRDPIEERGGVNIYSFVDNKPPNRVDAIGFRSITLVFDAFINKRLGAWFPEPYSLFWEFLGDLRDFGGGSSRLKTTIHLESGNVGGLSYSNATVDPPHSDQSVRRNWATGEYQWATAIPTQEVQISNYPDGCRSAIHVRARAAYPFNRLAPAIDYDVIWLLEANTRHEGISVVVIAEHNLFPDYESLLNRHVILRYETWWSGPGLIDLNLSTTSIGRGFVRAEVPHRCCARR